MEFEKNKKGWEIDLLPVNECSKSGDCILLRYGDLYKGGKAQNVIIIDGGYSATATAIKTHLQKYYNCYYDGQYHITAVFLSHTDQDHISGLVKLFEDKEIAVEYLIANIPWRTATRAWFKDNRITPNSLRKDLQDIFDSLYRLVKMAEEDKKAEVWNAVDHLGTISCNGAKMHILGPSKSFYNTCLVNSEKTKQQDPKVPQLNTTTVASLDKEEKYIKGEIEWPDVDSTSPMNESSIVCLFEYEGMKILFTGDSGREGLDAALEYADNNNIELSDTAIIKMPHHGSRHNIKPSFLDTFTKKNKTCYISCAPGDEGHHPSKRLVNLLNEKGFRVCTTSGSILHRSSNAPDRGWSKVVPLPTYPTMEKLDL